MLTKIELPLNSVIYVQSYDLEDLIKVISPLKILGYISDDDAKDRINDSTMVRVYFRICQCQPTKN